LKFGNVQALTDMSFEVMGANNQHH
jgi:hypothetical protein